MTRLMHNDNVFYSSKNAMQYFDIRVDFVMFD